MPQALMPDLQECQRLAAGLAITLRPAGDRVLVVLRGRAWLTFDRPMEGGDETRGGDFFLCPGDSLEVRAGQAVVLEAAGRAGEALAYGWRVAQPADGLAQAWTDVRQATAGLLRASRLLAAAGLAHAVRASSWRGGYRRF